MSVCFPINFIYKHSWHIRLDMCIMIDELCICWQCRQMYKFIYTHTHMYTHIVYTYKHTYICIICEINYIFIMFQVFTFMWGKWYSYEKIAEMSIVYKNYWKYYGFFLENFYALLHPLTCDSQINALFYLHLKR